MPLNDEQRAELARLIASRDSVQVTLDNFYATGAYTSASITTPSGTTRMLSRANPVLLAKRIGQLNYQINVLKHQDDDKLYDYQNTVRLVTRDAYDHDNDGYGIVDG